ncbi:MAG: hypothetical protein ACP5JG_08260 [Anaerolineae bacterium]
MMCSIEKGFVKSASLNTGNVGRQRVAHDVDGAVMAFPQDWGDPTSSGVYRRCSAMGAPWV